MMSSSSPSTKMVFILAAVIAFSIICCKQQQGFDGCYNILLPVAAAGSAATPQKTPDINVGRRRRKALLVETLRQAQIEDPEEILFPHSNHQNSNNNNNLLFGKALQDTILSDPDSSIDLLSICRLQCRIEFIQQQKQKQQDDDNDIDNQLKDLQSECVTEMFELTQQTGIDPPNITLAFGSNVKAKNTDFINWCYRLLTSNYYCIEDNNNNNDNNLETLRTQMVLYNPYWKAAVKATYLQKIMTKNNNNNDNDNKKAEQKFDEIIQDPKLFADAIRYLASLSSYDEDDK